MLFNKLVTDIARPNFFYLLQLFYDRKDIRNILVLSQFICEPKTYKCMARFKSFTIRKKN